MLCILARSLSWRLQAQWPRAVHPLWASIFSSEKWGQYSVFGIYLTGLLSYSNEIIYDKCFANVKLWWVDDDVISALWGSRSQTENSLSVFQPLPASKFIQGYLGAVISAVSIAVGNTCLHFICCIEIAFLIFLNMFPTLQALAMSWGLFLKGHWGGERLSSAFRGGFPTSIQLLREEGTGGGGGTTKIKVGDHMVYLMEDVGGKE